MLCWNRIGLWAALVATIALTIPSAAAAGNFLESGERSAIISMGRNPEPPACASPSDTVQIWWNITYSTTPQKVIFTLRDPNGATIDSVYYDGATGVNITRTWVVPYFPVEGKYWLRVEYWSFQAGHEATAEVSFYVCVGTGRICAQKVKDADCDGQMTLSDQAVPNWWLCIETPWGDEFCQQTNANGIACWENLPLGTYIITDPPVPGWIPLLSPTREAVLTEDEPQKNVAFFNVKYDDCFGACCKCDGECVNVTPAICDEIGYEFMGLGTHCEDIQCPAPSATEKSTWGKIKENYRNKKK